MDSLFLIKILVSPAILLILRLGIQAFIRPRPSFPNPHCRDHQLHLLVRLRSVLNDEARSRVQEEWHEMYERVWDEADYVVPPAENGAFFVMTNVIITPNQRRTTCPEDHTELQEAQCRIQDGEN